VQWLHDDGALIVNLNCSLTQFTLIASMKDGDGWDERFRKALHGDEHIPPESRYDPSEERIELE
jgi:hypothetical protein